jgi:hypothetical protein
MTAEKSELKGGASITAPARYTKEDLIDCELRHDMLMEKCRRSLITSEASMHENIWDQRSRWVVQNNADFSPSSFRHDKEIEICLDEDASDIHIPVENFEAEELAEHTELRIIRLHEIKEGISINEELGDIIWAGVGNARESDIASGDFLLNDFQNTRIQSDTFLRV